MLEESRKGNIDLIITKSISRFARNTVTVLKYVRELKNLGVGIFFELQNINTLSNEGELMLTILAAFAQAESEGASENAKMTYRRKFKQGNPLININRILGYDLDEYGDLVINREQAEIVMLIFDMDKYGLRMMGRYTDEQPFSCKVICGTCGGIYYRRTWTRSNGKHIVWQCEERYKVKGVIGCSNVNLHEEDLEKAFVASWNSVIENKENYMKRCSKSETDGNELEKLRARQFKELAEKGALLEEIDNEIVSLVLDRVEVYESGILNIFFLDGTKIEIAINE